MIIWLNGPLGVGKTTIGKVLKSKLESFEILDGDECFLKFCEENKNKPHILLASRCAVETQDNHYYIQYMKNVIDVKAKEKNLIVVATVFKDIGKRELIDYLRGKYDFKHIILLAERETIGNRIKRDTKRKDSTIALDCLDESLNYLNIEFGEDIRIYIDEKSPEESSDEIIDMCNINK